ncbi:hypothetical protein EMPS_08758 [Entomortierella parvispora]|uniref:Uncharacterized protein n=1 Tax=Entomortierella parvispora TaxID=205924 RepID=A0A9P3HGM4_9FUNG|nr:hypothetical protein EMPS_08758 [Entomortierella parvispora]
MSNIQLSQLQSTLAHHFLGWSLTENNRVSDEQFQKNDACSSSSSFCSSSIESEDDTIDKEPRRGHSCTARTPVLDTATASDMEKDWAETHELLWPEGDYYMAKKTFIREGVAHLRRGRRYVFVEPVLGPAASYLYPRWSSPSTAGTTTTTTTGTSEATTSSHLSSTTTSATRHAAAGGAEGVSFPTAALSTDSINSLSHPDHGAADGDENSTSNNGYLVTPHGGPRHENDEDVLDANEQDKDQNEEGDGRCQDENPAPGGRREGGEGLEKVQEEEQGHNEGDRVLAQNDESVTEDRASAGRPLQQLLLDNKDTDPAGLIGGERFEKEDSEETMATGPNGAPTATSTTTNTPELSNPSTVTSTTTTASAESSSTDPSTLDNTLFDSSVQDATLEDSYPHLDEPSLEPYSPLLDPATDGQDQFEYGLYELQYIPKIQYLHPDQFLPTRQSFIVHLDEDRPTLASPVPTPRPLSSSSSFSLSSLASSSQSRPLTRTECRCQLMMRKALMQQDLLQVWPPVAPIRTLQERLQDAEEEARMMEIKQKVQLQTMHWRKALMTQTVVCG